MPTQVVMPQMGESVAEGTIVRWLKKVGDAVERDEPLFEISTDKVDAEIPAPAAGVISEIKVKDGETVPVNSVVAVISDAMPAAAAAPDHSKAAPAPAPAAPDQAKAASAPAPVAENAPKDAAPAEADPAPSGASAAAGANAAAATAATNAPAATSAPAAPSPEKSASPVQPQPASAPSTPPPTTGDAPAAPARAAGRPVGETQAPTKPWSAADARALRLSPLVRRIARDNHLDARNIAGTGAGGRITKADILSYLEAGAPVSAPVATPPGPAPAVSAPGASPAPASRPEAVQVEGVERVPMTVMRRRISEHMVMSRRTSAHVHTVFEVDFTKVDEIRKANKTAFEKKGAKLTYLTFITNAVAKALKAVPIVNASVDGNDILYKKDINIGVAVALDWGLIVPVIKHADQLSLFDISKCIADVAARARDKKLSPDDVRGGTFTITNPGVFGALFGMPIINQPQVAILGVGAVEKRAVVINDGIAIRLRAYLSIGYDHRIIDGAIADEFMSHVKKTLENFEAPPA